MKNKAPLPGWVCTALMRIGTHMATVFDRRMAEFGLTQAQFRTLLSLCDEELSPTELADRSMLERATTSLVAQRMVASEWLERKPGPNRRTHLLSVTPKGQEALHQALPPATELAEAAVAALSEDELEQLARLLGKMEAHLREEFGNR